MGIFTFEIQDFPLVSIQSLKLVAIIALPPRGLRVKVTFYGDHDRELRNLVRLLDLQVLI